jgi:hypothetical protein
VFSDQRCGDDAKIVPGITTRKRSTPNTAKSNKALPKSAQELRKLSEQCDAGDIPSCTAWTKGGGPNQLREEERQLEASCEAGSLADCEQRYCRDGGNDQCRTHVLQTAKLSGESWYLRHQENAPDGLTTYAVRCLRDGGAKLRDVTIACSALAAPNRCNVRESGQAFARMDQAAAEYCRRPQ